MCVQAAEQLRPEQAKEALKLANDEIRELQAQLSSLQAAQQQSIHTQQQLVSKLTTLQLERMEVEEKKEREKTEHAMKEAERLEAEEAAKAQAEKERQAEARALSSRRAPHPSWRAAATKRATMPAILTATTVGWEGGGRERGRGGLRPLR